MGLTPDGDSKIRVALDRDSPVLPSASGNAPSIFAGRTSPPDIAKLYEFPPFDGRGQTIGVLSLSGTIVKEDIVKYSKTFGMPAPDITTVFIAGHTDATRDQNNLDVTMDVECIYNIVPRASIRVYLAPNTQSGFAEAIKHATADRVSILSIGWGGPEGVYSNQHIDTVNAVLEVATKQGITVLTTIGDDSSYMNDDADFPASSPWVLSVGGSTLTAKGGSITSETVRCSGDRATRGWASKRNPCPDWQSAVSVPNRAEGLSGRLIPDVVASTSPEYAVGIIHGGAPVVVGGPSVALSVWVGLIARINQALGYNVGYLNPRLYRKIGPAGVLRSVEVEGHSVELGWNPAAGWGSPDGMKLLTWLREHPNS